MKQSLQLRTSQHLALTPQLQQSIRLLQLSTQELQQELEQIVQNNPMLERLDDQLDGSLRLLADGAISPTTQREVDSDNTEVKIAATTEAEHDENGASSTASDSSIDWSGPDHFSRSNHAPEDDDAPPQIEAPQLSLRDMLEEQTRLNVRDTREQALITILIDAINDNGYLSEPLEEILAGLPAELGITMKEMAQALDKLQSFDPAGVGARDISECLAIQVRQLPNVPFVTRKRALAIVQSHLMLFAKRDFNKLRKALDCDDEDLREAQEVIRRCNPHPGAAFATDEADAVVPDVIIKRIKDNWQVELNPEVMPRLRLNSMYADILKNNRGSASLATQLQEAKWLIKNMQQRFETILRVSQAIVERQKNFFSHGAVAMRPLVLREIADTLGLHESTISRVTSQKYMLTPHGMYELKYFFGSHVATEAGGEASSTAIRELIKQLIGAEDPKNPLSDSKIAAMLGEQGMVIARRTVAKYRESMKIQPVSLRKSL